MYLTIPHSITINDKKSRVSKVIKKSLKDTGSSKDNSIVLYPDLRGLYVEIIYMKRKPYALHVFDKANSNTVKVMSVANTQDIMKALVETNCIPAELDFQDIISPVISNSTLSKVCGLLSVPNFLPQDSIASKPSSIIEGIKNNALDFIALSYIPRHEMNFTYKNLSGFSNPMMLDDLGFITPESFSGFEVTTTQSRNKIALGDLLEPTRNNHYGTFVLPSGHIGNNYALKHGDTESSSSHVTTVTGIEATVNRFGIIRLNLEIEPVVLNGSTYTYIPSTLFSVEKMEIGIGSTVVASIEGASNDDKDRATSLSRVARISDVLNTVKTKYHLTKCPSCKVALDEGTCEYATCFSKRADILSYQLNVLGVSSMGVSKAESLISAHGSLYRLLSSGTSEKQLKALAGMGEAAAGSLSDCISELNIAHWDLSTLILLYPAYSCSIFRKQVLTRLASSLRSTANFKGYTKLSQITKADLYTTIFEVFSYRSRKDESSPLLTIVNEWNGFLKFAEQLTTIKGN